MSTRPAASTPPPAPDSPEGQRITDALSNFEAEVLTRLTREGQPIPGEPALPATRTA